MNFASKTAVERWQPDFSSSGQASPVWTRIVVRGHVVTNTLEAASWTEPVVQLCVCESCGQVGCAAGGYAEVSRLHNGAVLVSPPSVDQHLRPQVVPARFFDALGSIVIEAAEWQRWQALVPSLPSVAVFPPTSHGHLLRAWACELPAPYQASSPEAVLAVLSEALVACDSLEVPAALAVAERLVLIESTGPFILTKSPRDSVESLYLDSLEFREWPAFRLQPEPALAFSGGWVATRVPGEPQYKPPP